MEHKSIFTDVENATVVVKRKGCQGVFVHENLILTAAHCVNFNFDGLMSLGAFSTEEIETSSGEQFKVGPIAVDPISDVAILGPLEDEAFPKEAESFLDFCEHVKPVKLCQSVFEKRKAVDIYVYTHNKSWVSGTATQFGYDEKQLWIETEEQIDKGTSGSPIINNVGELIGVASNFSKDQKKCRGSVIRPHFALPVWVCRMINKGMFS